MAERCRCLPQWVALSVLAASWLFWPAVAAAAPRTPAPVPGDVLPVAPLAWGLVPHVAPHTPGHLLQNAPPVCREPAIRLTPDYAYAVGSVGYADADGEPESGSTYRWLVDGQPGVEERIAEQLSLPLDGTLQGRNGEEPVEARAVNFGVGRWRQSLALGPSGLLTFARDGNLELEAGTVELWLALAADGNDPAYASRSHVLWQYRSPGGDWIGLAIDRTRGMLHAGGQTGGQWQSAWGLSTRSWKAGEWHHVTYTYSAADNFMRLYVDGRRVADTNERHYWPPASDGVAFTVGGDAAGNAAALWIDELRISGRVPDEAEIAARARRSELPGPNEVWRSTADLAPGTTLGFEVTPANARSRGMVCRSPTLVYPGIPVVDPQPPSTLLPPGSTRVDLRVRSLEPTACAWALDEALPFDAMTSFGEPSPSIDHQTTIDGLKTDPNWTNSVYVRCGNHPDFVLHLRYRALSDAHPSYPRSGNLWGSGAFLAGDLARAARIDLWLGAAFAPAQIRALRRLNPDIRVLTSINAVEQSGLPEDYYLHDTQGHRIEVWPGSHRLNLTKPYVAEHQARLAYQLILESDLQFDGCFFDNVFTTQSWQSRDIYGRPVQIDANEDGQADDPAWLDAAWKAGVMHELALFRSLMPHAIVSGHAQRLSEPGIADIFNGTSIGFQSADVIEGRMAFDTLWHNYSSWMARARPPRITMIESSPPDQIAYGYDYAPWENAPPATIEFARTYYPYMRFGLALTLLDDGYFAHEWGDTWHGNDWWYDELDHDLGQPLGPAERLTGYVDPGPNLVDNGDFESELDNTWRLWVNTAAGCQATVRRDTTDRVSGDASARIDIATTSGEAWHIDLAQFGRSWEKAIAYEVSFWAKADRDREITLSAQKGSPDWRNYGLWRSVTLSPSWEHYALPFEATETTSESRLQFLVGAVPGTVWIDDVRVGKRGPDIFRRAFEHGLVLLNASRVPQTVPVAPGYARLVGAQAPRYEAILDDDSPHVEWVGDWQAKTVDSGEWQAGGPFYHDWGSGCHELVVAGGEARWSLPIGTADGYTLTVWWPALPDAPWTAAATYEIVAADRVVAARTLDQRSEGDRWHLVGRAELDPAQAPYLRLRCATAPCIADAVHLRSFARYNDGAPVESVTLAPLDGIVLRRTAWRTALPMLLLSTPAR